ncbi:uncharacterized protein LOC110838631 isoform X2 [Zootermopsis nevadensis]|uniref:Uncharacterized protein n=1 Tax=Zootermopsis nevadensis TaxID=136037 RepID=A0A067QMW2_ZOONE|nr:uncharacterized protein LOC110838631 isoform X2 [Zootermopsis nevadensis]KDR09562.1 hypothetical protein L798_00521 [Zootermopsis nevadensis]
MIHSVGRSDSERVPNARQVSVPTASSMGQRTLRLHQRRLHANTPHTPCALLHSPPISNASLPFRNTSYLWLFALVFVSCSGTFLASAEGNPVTSPVEQRVFKRSPSEGEIAVADYPDYQAGVRYDEYPVVVPKRTALLLDKIMVALQKAVEDGKGDRNFASNVAENKMDLQRRGQQKGRVYWRCYFNAVTCFKRK